MSFPWFQRKIDERRASPRPKRREILVVDDQAEVRAVLQDMLERLGWTVRTAGGPDEALEVLGEHAAGIGLALIDVMMPGCDGVSLALRLRQIHPELAVVMLSGRLREETRWVVSEQGFRFLPKPFALVELGAVVTEVMGDARPEDPRV